MIEVASEQHMRSLGERIGRLLRGGELLELVGDVGAGKTTFTKGLALGLAIDEDIQSPSFTISRTYDARDSLLLAHYDFYRLSEPGIMADELREVVADPTVVTVIEWASIAEGVLPDDRITIRIAASGEATRSVELHAGGPKSAKLLREIDV